MRLPRATRAIAARGRARPALAAAAVLAMLAAPALGGCAGLAPLSPPASAAAGRAAAPAPAGTFAPAAVDSTPSSDALAVLGNIPEPLSPSERVPAPAPAVAALPASRASGAANDAAASGGAAGAAADSAAGAPVDTAGAGVPVPAPTLPIGERPGEAGQALPESALVPSAPPSATPARPDTCWRVQVGAPPEKAKAEALQSVASSQMLTPFVVDLEKKRYKVRTRDCMNRAAADALCARAERSGFKGTFVVKTVVKAKKP